MPNTWRHQVLGIRRMASDWNDPEVDRRRLERIPLGRIAEVEGVTGPVLFFLGPASAFVTGQILYVDGRITATQRWWLRVGTPCTAVLMTVVASGISLRAYGAFVSAADAEPSV